MEHSKAVRKPRTMTVALVRKQLKSLEPTYFVEQIDNLLAWQERQGKEFTHRLGWYVSISIMRHNKLMAKKPKPPRTNANYGTASIQEILQGMQQT